SPSQKYEVIGADQFSYTYTPASPEEQTLANRYVSRGIWLRNGTFLAAEVISSDGSAFVADFAGRKNIKLSNQQIAHIAFRGSRHPFAFEATDRKTGVLLNNGDLLESEVQELKG